MNVQEPTTHYASDEQGSITHVLGEDENGEYDLKNYYEYGAFGDFREKYEEVENRFGYNGEIYDPIGGQYYLRARYYNPVIGRFKQEDTYYGDGLNLYAYCRNLPVGYEDPSGHVAKSICEKKLKELEEKKANGTLTDAEKKQLKRYERAKNDPLYQLERMTGQSSSQLYSILKKEGYTRNKDGTWKDKDGNKVSNAELKKLFKSNQIHHYATNKSKKYTQQFVDIINKYGLDLDGDWNKELLPHQGRHPNKYHEFVLDEMRDIDNIANGNVDIFLDLYESNIKEVIRNNPEMLYRNYWKELAKRRK